jgi:2-keto-4-pentenoate hydratase
MKAVETMGFASADRIAQRFTAARMSATALLEYPGPVPPDLASAYECQDAAIALWRDEIAGWKIGRIAPAFEQKLSQMRLAGPVFRKAVQIAKPGETNSFGVFDGGFAAVEAEYIFEVAKDAPVGQLSWSMSETAELAGRMHVGVEMAGSPLATINLLGPTVVVSDFGNNAGLILGPEVPDWRTRRLSDLVCETFIDGVSVGQGSAANLTGGPLTSLSFVAELCAARGRPLKKGMLISTGAATGIHDINAGQSARMEFKGIGTILCSAHMRTVHDTTTG